MITFRPLAILACCAAMLATVRAEDAPQPMREFCFKCHAGDKVKGDVHLDRLDKRGSLVEKLSARDLLETALGEVQRCEMPPAKATAQPDAAQRAVLATWLGAQIEELDRATPPQAGRVTVRRLNREEYRATIRDLIGVEFNRDFDPTRDFPADGSGHGFDNIGNVLATSPLLLQRYLDAAEAILAKAVVVDGLDGPRTWTFTGAQLRSPEAASAGRWSGQIEVRQEGDYLIRATLRCDQGDQQEVPMAWAIDGQEPQGFAWKRSAQPSRSERKVRLGRGSHDLAVLMRQAQATAGSAACAVAVDVLEVQGPLGLVGTPLPATHQRIFIARPKAAGERAAVARQVLAAFARRAFRRPVAADEVARYLALFTAADRDGESFEGAMLAPLAAMLVSPSFLYRVESDRAVDPATGAYALDSHEIAARLSYFLWSSMPDDELFRLADTGTLTDPAVIAKQVARMLADPKADALPRVFVPQWLQIGRVETFIPDQKAAGELGTNLRRAMMDEPVLLFRHVLHEDRSLLELLDADYTFLDEDLAKLYDIAGVKDPEAKGRKDRTLVQHELTSGRRGGVLTMAAVLAATSYPDRTSAVKRGKFVLEAILGAAPPPPPPDVKPLIDASKGDKQARLTLRQQLERHRADATCAACHARMDPLGFGLENFNPLGKWRDKDATLPIDASGTMPDGRTFAGPEQLKKLLLERKDEFARCLAEKLLTYALGRGLEPFDRRTVSAVATATKAGGYHLSAMITAICQSFPFRNRAGPDAAEPISTTESTNTR